ncbi:class I SAM-dependent methyltransferase [Actinophytocola sp.]|uniref:class I SAM-dependent methyltransferase n=1 Tax=Actinophytocola sp. TaxID=1872138 RepID=UPI0025C3E726|nr:class I SAM-dependent methyltransferase [Actinophytocola sp.]
MRGSQRLFEHGRFYDAFARRLAGGLYRRVVDDVVLAEPRPGAVLLDAGCGPGRLAMDIARARPDATVHGVDLAAGAIEVAVDRAARAGLADRTRFLCGDLADLPFPDGTFDLVVSTVSYHHWAHVSPVVAELARVLRPDGRLWVYDARAMPATPFRDAAREAMPDRAQGRAIVRTGWFPVPIFQRLAVSRSA